MKRIPQPEELATLKADIDMGLADLADDRVQNFDAPRITDAGESY
ncbi:MAG: hypothetical protein P4M00_09405 [Azospirillaceae bacterium]|nr:hypothetical protein [Azospirillaceae bacterium]